MFSGSNYHKISKLRNFYNFHFALFLIIAFRCGRLSRGKQVEIMSKAVIFGAGNIGRGLVGRILFESEYKVTFVDVNEKLIKLINSAKGYPIYVTIGNEYDHRNIKNVNAIDGNDIDAVISTAKDVSVIATAVGVNALKYIIPSIAAIIKQRYIEQPDGYLNFILCENMIDVHLYVKEMLKEKLTEAEYMFMEEHIGFCQSSIGCMVPAPAEELLKKNALAVAVEDYNKIYTDKDGVRGELPDIDNIVAYSPFSFYINRKLFMHNMSHSVCAYLGFHKGYTYIWQSILDQEIRNKVERALEETASALSLNYNVEMRELNEHAEDLVRRYGNKLLADTVARVGADPKRKLGKNDRLIGAARFCLDNSINPSTIIDVLPLVFSFDVENDPSSKEVSSYYKEHGLAESIKKYCQLNETEPLFGKIIAADKKNRKEQK